MPRDRVITLPPSDLTFLWKECRRCFWMKTKGIMKRPSSPFPKIFTRLDVQTKDFFFGRRAEEVSPDLRPGRVVFGDRWVKSSPLEVPGHRSRVAIAGKLDTALAFDDGTYGIIDFKTSEPRPEHVAFYWRQLQAYALAAERPAEGALSFSPVTQLGLLCVEPVAMVDLEEVVAYKAVPHFLEVERDDDAFLAFLSEVLYTLERPEPPDASGECTHCRFLAVGALLILTRTYEKDER